MQDVGGDHSQRIDRLEGEFGGLRTEFGGLRNEVGVLSTDVAGVKSDIKSLGGILARIEEGVTNAQLRSEQRAIANKPNIVAVISILITIISILIGGAWTISGSLAHGEERDIQQTRLIDGMVKSRDRELDRQERDLHRVEDRINAQRQ